MVRPRVGTTGNLRQILFKGIAVSQPALSKQALKKKRQQAEEKIAADTITGSHCVGCRADRDLAQLLFAIRGGIQNGGRAYCQGGTVH